MKAYPLISSIKILFAMLLIISNSSCNNSTYKEKVAIAPTDLNESYKTVAKVKDVEEVAPSIPEKNAVPAHLKIIKSANVRYKVANVKIATDRIKNMTVTFDSYISDLRFENNLYETENRFTIKVPKQHFDQLLDTISTVADFIEYENITTEDVTEKYIDITTRLQTKLDVKQRYEKILRKKAATVEDILVTEEKLHQLQEEIEAAQGRLTYLESKTSYSTIQVDLYETVMHQEEPESYTQTFVSKIKDGFSFGWSLIKGILIAVIYIWPLVLLSTIVFFIFRKRKKK